MSKHRNVIMREIAVNGNQEILQSIYPSNELQLSRYSWLSIVPRNLFEQFQRISNLWFLVVSIFQLIPFQLNPTNS